MQNVFVYRISRPRARVSQLGDFFIEQRVETDVLFVTHVQK